MDDVTSRYTSGIHWDPKLKKRVRSGTEAVFSEGLVRPVAYRPFVRQYVYGDPAFAQRPAQTGSIFPQSTDRANHAICVTGIGSTKPFSALIVDTMPDLELISKGQCFPRYRFERRRTSSEGPDLFQGLDGERIDNIPEAAVRRFREHYREDGITGDDIFHYVYGVLHSPAYRERFANDLAREIPRVPLAPDFHAFAAAGHEIAALHLGYETCPEHPLTVTSTGPEPLAPHHFRFGAKTMRFANPSRSELILNEFVRLGGIPSAAHDYEVNGRTPLGWFMDRYRVTEDRESGIRNDPNDWFPNPRDILPAIRRIIHVSVETTRIVNSLPDPFEKELHT